MLRRWCARLIRCGGLPILMSLGLYPFPWKPFTPRGIAVRSQICGIRCDSPPGVQVCPAARPGGKEPRRSSRVPREPDRCRNPDPAVLVAALLDVMSVGAPELFGGALLRCAVVCERGARPQARECASRVTSLPDTFIARLAIGLQE